MKLHTINTGLFKLDGGAMFGVVPRRMWSKLNPPDENNMCTWAMRCLLVETADRLVLIDTGIGEKQDEKFRSHFESHGDANLHSSIRQAGFELTDVTDVILTHLHFDHCGGAVLKTENGALVPTFPNATYWTNEKHWQWACRPNPREMASFLKENFLPLEEAGVLKFAKENEEIIPGILPHFGNGHTEAMMVLEIHNLQRPLFYCADLVPSKWHIGLPWVMAYDVRPLETMKEKADFLEMVFRANGVLMFEHDPKTECCDLVETERGFKKGVEMRVVDL